MCPSGHALKPLEPLAPLVNSVSRHRQAHAEELYRLAREYLRQRHKQPWALTAVLQDDKAPRVRKRSAGDTAYDGFKIRTYNAFGVVTAPCDPWSLPPLDRSPQELRSLAAAWAFAALWADARDENPDALCPIPALPFAEQVRLECYVERLCEAAEQTPRALSRWCERAAKALGDTAVRLGHKRRGARPQYDAAQDRRIAEAWQSGRFKTHAELGREMGYTSGYIKRALDRHRKHQERRR